MRDCVVVGCGRSGTSLAAGLLAHAGYDCGEDLLPPDDGAPTGFFEARGVNRINELLLAPHDDVLRRDGYSRRLRDGERWLAVLPDHVEIELPPELRGALSRALPASPLSVAWRKDMDAPLVRGFVETAREAAIGLHGPGGLTGSVLSG